MPSTALLGGLLQGFTGVALDRQDQKHQDEMQARRDRIAILSNIDPSQLDPSQLPTLAGLLDEVYGGGKGTKGKGGQGGPFTQLFEKIGPLFHHGKAGPQAQGGGLAPPPRPDGLANVVPADAQPGGAPPRVTNPAEVLQGGQPKLETVPQPGNVPQAGANVPRGTIHPPMTAGQLWVSQDPTRAASREIEVRQAQAEKFRSMWEAKHGKLTPDQEDELEEWTMGMPAGFGRAGRGSKVIARGVIGPNGEKADLMEDGSGRQYYIPAYEKPAAPPKPTAAQQKRDQRIKDMMAARPGMTEAQADRAVSLEDYTDELQKRLYNRFRSDLTETQANAAAQRLTQGNPTTKDARFVLKDAQAQAKERMKIAMQEAKAGYPSTEGKPGPDQGKTEDQLAVEILEGQGFNADEVRKLAAGSTPRRTTPKGGAPSGDANDPMGILK